MADILLNKPESDQIIILAPQADDRLVFEFRPDEALLERQGDNLVLSFENGSRIELADFYVSYTSENMPEFVIGNSIVSGEAFFAALSEDLMPAAGNEGSGPNGSGTGVGVEGANTYGNDLGTAGNLNVDNSQGEQGPSSTNRNDGGPLGDNNGAGGGAGGDAGSGTPAPTYYNGDISFAGDKAQVSNVGLKNADLTGGLTISAGRINLDADASNEVTVQTNIHMHRQNWAPGGVHSEGIGVAGSGSGGDGHAAYGSWRDNGYNLDKDGQAWSEAIVVDLPNGELGYGANLELSGFYAKTGEKALVQFYRDGQLVDSVEVTSTSTHEEGIFNITTPIVDDGNGFDRIVLSALDNGTGKYNNNSDFLLKSIDFLQPDADAQLPSDLVANTADDTLYGDVTANILLGEEGDDILYGLAGNDFLDGGSGDDILYGGTGDDVIALDINDIFVDGGDTSLNEVGKLDVGFDVLLGGTADKQDVIDKMDAGDITGMELVVLGKDVNGQNVDDVLSELGLSKAADGDVVVPNSDWTQVGQEQTIGGREFMEFSNNDDTNVTILVETTKLEGGNF